MPLWREGWMLSQAQRKENEQISDAEEQVEKGVGTLA